MKKAISKKKQKIITIIFFLSNIAYTVLSWFIYLIWGITEPSSEKFPIDPFWSNMLFLAVIITYIVEFEAHVFLYKKVLYDAKILFSAMCVFDTLLFTFMLWIELTIF
ncbi:MAG: hypothetical protein LBL93_05065 [Ruminococcus sp.]|jgi:hypothetical protein|nr:hypothetical protein [Ruminococcus sp.]